MALKKHAIAARRRLRIRNRLKKVANNRPRLSVFRSAKNIYAQVIDDREGITIASASTVEPDLSLRGKRNIDAATTVGRLVAERAKAKGIEEVFFDRGSYLYHGRIKALADAAREAGLKF
ncbi:MAG: 50S ribosomal protein L18 [Neomegalonema sp.]|nr:50S ribosomal protein L18 [Neomegalonema sp.]